MTPRVTGIGGVFFKARDPEGLREWYRRHLGIDGSKGQPHRVVGASPRTVSRMKRRCRESHRVTLRHPAVPGARRRNR
jgi:hypothetical protein